MNIRLGMIGTGRIAHRFVPEARTVDVVEVVAVYHPKKERAKAFANEMQIENATDEIEEFCALVDAVYIATPHETHAAYVWEMLMHRKHVLCEKPMVFSKNEAQELYALAKKRHCILMEGIKSAYCPGFQAILDVVKSGTIGMVCDVEACFSRLSPSNVREVWDKKYGGSFTEFGTYTLLPIVKLLGTEVCESHIWSHETATGVDGYTKAVFDYGTAIATVKTGLSVKSEGQLLIAGTKGYLLAPSPWWLTRRFEVHYEDASKIDIYEFPFEGQGLRYEIAAFAQKIQHLSSSTADVWEALTEDESIWIAAQMEKYLNRRAMQGTEVAACKKLYYWAHRGCSMQYPENTLEAFAAAADLNGLTGIELDVQMTKDNELVVIHDETVDRTTDKKGDVQSFTLEELKKLQIESVDGQTTTIPTLEEVFQLLEKSCKEKGLLINIELKNSKIRYQGMEERILKLVEKYQLAPYIVYSSFLPESMKLIRTLAPDSQTAILGMDIRTCLEEQKRVRANAIHPWVGGLFLEKGEIDTLGEVPVRVWDTQEPLFGEKKAIKEKDLDKYVRLGATDIITNVPEKYIC